MDEVKPSPDEIENGWTKESLAAYLRDRRERADAPELVGGNVVTTWDRPRPAIRIYSALDETGWMK